MCHLMRFQIQTILLIIALFFFILPNWLHVLWNYVCIKQCWTWLVLWSCEKNKHLYSTPLSYSSVFLLWLIQLYIHFVLLFHAYCRSMFEPLLSGEMRLMYYMTSFHVPSWENDKYLLQIFQKKLWELTHTSVTHSQMLFLVFIETSWFRINLHTGNFLTLR